MGLLSIARGKGTGSRREAVFDAAAAGIGAAPYGTEVNNAFNTVENFDIDHPYGSAFLLAAAADATTNDWDTSQAFAEVALDLDNMDAWAELAEENPVTELPANVGDAFFDTIAGTAETLQEPLEDDDLDLGYVILEGVELGAELFEQPFEYLGDPSEPINNGLNGEVPVGDDTEVYNQDPISYIRDTLGMDPNPAANAGEQAANNTTQNGTSAPQTTETSGGMGSTPTATETHTPGQTATPVATDQLYTEVLGNAAEEELEGMIQYVEQQSGTDLTTSEISDELEMYDSGNKVGLEQDALDRAYEGSGQEAPNAEDLAITVRENGQLVQDFNQSEYESIVDLAEEN